MVINEQKFQIGDIVERINNEHAGMRIGDTDEIIKVEEDGGEIRITLKKFNGYDGKWKHDPMNLRLVKKKDVLSNLELW